MKKETIIFLIVICESLIGSEEERKVVKFANRFSSKAEYQIYEPAVSDVTFTLDVADEVRIGDVTQATVNVKNESSEQRTVTASLTAILMYYTGRAARTLEQQKRTIVLEPSEGDVKRVVCNNIKLRSVTCYTLFTCVPLKLVFTTSTGYDTAFLWYFLWLKESKRGYNQ